MSLLNLYKYENTVTMIDAMVKSVVSCAQEAQAERGVFHWVVAGGGTPQRCYERLAKEPIDWTRTHLWIGDERCYPIGHSERNDVMLEQSLLSHIDFPAEQLHRIPAELGPEAAAIAYQHQVVNVSTFDLIWLGIGEDGHTASLFPGLAKKEDERTVLPVYNAPKLPPERVSLGLPVMQAARKVQLLITGEGKRAAYQKIQADESLPASWPDADWHVCFGSVLKTDST